VQVGLLYRVTLFESQNDKWTANNKPRERERERERSLELKDEAGG